MKEVIIELDDMYSEVLSITAIGKHGNITNISTKAVELSKGVVIKFDGENWTQRKIKHTGVVLEDENKEVASDLISRSALIDYIKTWDVGCGIGHDQKTFIEAIARQPIVFDVDAVIKELGEYRDFITIQGRGFVDGAISIVRKGGV